LDANPGSDLDAIQHTWHRLAGRIQFS
jgi:hypothetical protein